MDFEEFLNLCRDADKLLDSLKHKPRLQGRAPRNLKPAAIHYLARKRGQKITLNHLYIIYGIRHARVIEIKKLLKGATEPTDPTKFHITNEKAAEGTG